MWEATVVVSRGAERCRVDVAQLETYKRAGWTYVADGDSRDTRKALDAEINALAAEDMAKAEESADKAARQGKTVVSMTPRK